MTTAICMSKVYESQSDDKAKQGLHDRIDEYVRYATTGTCNVHYFPHWG